MPVCDIWTLYKQVGYAAVWHVFGTAVNIAFSFHGFTHVQLHKKSPSAAHSQQMAVFTARRTCQQISCDQWLFSKHRLCWSMRCSICSVDLGPKTYPHTCSPVVQWNCPPKENNTNTIYQTRKPTCLPARARSLYWLSLAGTCITNERPNTSPYSSRGSFDE